MAYSAHTHLSDKLQRTKLHKLNGIPLEEKLENLLVLLSDDCKQSTATIIYLPNNLDVTKSISNFPPPPKKTGLVV